MSLWPSERVGSPELDCSDTWSHSVSENIWRTYCTHCSKHPNVGRREGICDLVGGAHDSGASGNNIVYQKDFPRFCYYLLHFHRLIVFYCLWPVCRQTCCRLSQRCYSLEAFLDALAQASFHQGPCKPLRNPEGSWLHQRAARNRNKYWICLEQVSKRKACDVRLDC